MVSFTPLVLLLAAASAAPSLEASPRALATIEQVNQDVDNIDTNVKHLTGLTRAYEGGILGATPQLAALSAVYLALAGGVVHSGLLPGTISAADAVGLVDHVNRTLAVDNPIAVDTLIAKRKQFQDAHVDGFIAPALELLLVGHESFSNNVLTRIPDDVSPELVAGGKAAVEVISDALRKGIKTFRN